ncbi:ORF6N domain-containing protein [Bacillus thuringiensis]|uniref:ORF6N domain-containing protein n=1 Tax=Bacillus thuringiensis TaxID=1428 RepID=UPI00197A9530|nr:ORF6N domain-containing protein [Bacillus thuringiensis]
MMNVIELKIQDEPKELVIKEFNGQRVVTFKDIDELHERVAGTAGRNFRENKEQFIEGENYFYLTGEKLREFKQTTNFVGSQAKELVLITQMGYLMLVKSLQDGLAWHVQRQLVNNYFKITGKKVIHPRKKPVNLVFRQEMDMAKTLASVAGVKEGIAYAVAIERAEQKTGENFSSYKKLLPAATHETGFLNPTQIGERIGKKARGVNQLLLEQGLQVKEDKEWRLTDEGKKYAEEMPYTRNGHSGYQIQWNESEVERLRV